MYADNNFVKELKQYLLKSNDLNMDSVLGYTGNGKIIFKNFFQKPVKLIFYWEESSFRGEICVLYEYKKKFILKSESFGSCSSCDYWQGTKNLKHLNEKILMSFNDIKIFDTLDEIELNDYSHPKLKDCFRYFKNEYKSTLL